MKSRAIRLSVMVALLMAAVVCAADDPLTPYRDRFQQGLDRYRSGDVAGAVEYWEPIRRELGDTQAFRLLYNLGKAYEALGDGTRAAERYEGFLKEADARERTGNLEPAVIEQQTEARQHLGELRRTRARIHVLASEHPGLVQIDLGEPGMGERAAYLAPGHHTVTIDAGTAHARKLEFDVKAGEEIQVDPTRIEPVSPPGVTSARPPASGSVFGARPWPAPPPAISSEPERPFSSVFLYIAGATMVLTLIVPAAYYRHARSISTEYSRSDTPVARRQELYDQYGDAKRDYQLSWIAPGTLAVVTGGLVYWYYAGSKERAVGRVGISPNGAGISVHGAF